MAKTIKSYKILINSLIFFLTIYSKIFSQNLYLSAQQFISAVVVHQKDLVSSDSNTTVKKIADFVKESSEKNFNTIIFSFEKEKFLVPKSSSAKELLCLSYLLQETKKYNIKLFVMIDTLKVGNEKIFSWLCKTEDKNYYLPYYYSPGNPEVQQYLINLTKNLLTTYEIDGIIFDNICYPEKNVSYDEISLYRFYTRGNPKLLDFFDYQKEQLNLLISRLYCTAKSINKNVTIGVTTKSEYRNPQMLSGCYYENFQDVKLWVEKNWVDFVVVKLKNINDIKNFVSVIPKDKIVGLISFETDQSNVNNLIQSNILGCILNFIPKNNYFVSTLSFPKFEFNYKILSGYVVDETSSPLVDVWITLLDPTNKELGFTLTTKNGEFYFIHSSTSELVLKFDYPWCETILSTITVSEGLLTTLPPTIIPNASVEKNKLFFYIHQPTNLQNYQKDTIHILGRTYPKYNVSLYTENFSTNIKVYPTGMFAVDKIKLSLGENILVFTISNPTKTKFTHQQIKVFYTTTTVSLQAKEKEFVVLSPTEDLLLFSSDVLELKIKSKKNKKFYAICFDNKEKIYLDEISDGVYYKRYLIPPNFSSNKTQLVFCYDEEIPKKFFWERKKIETVSYPTDYYVEVWNSAYPLIAETVSEKTPMTYGLHYVRLGGPYITELPKGIKLQVVGKQQDKYKVKLSSTFSGWVDQKDVMLKLNETKIPQNYFTSIAITTETEKDKIIIPWVERTPFSVSSSIEDNKLFLVIDFFNTHFATTWVINHLNTKVLDYPKISQIEDGHLRIVFPIKQKYIWGFWAKVTKSNLVIYVNHPPKINKENVLKGIKIGIEAGHGGDDNIGALGVSGTKEKNINLTAAQVLKSVLEKEGAKVVFLREGDTNPDFSKRLATAYKSNVDLIISLHANSTDTERNGYLKNSGFSVYYKWDHCRILAEEIFKELKNLWNTTDGLIGNFNYALIRQTRIPAVLIEQGYMTNPYDESKLLDKNFLYQESLLIKNALKKFIKKIIE